MLSLGFKVGQREGVEGGGKHCRVLLQRDTQATRQGGHSAHYYRVHAKASRTGRSNTRSRKSDKKNRTRTSEDDK